MKVSRDGRPWCIWVKTVHFFVEHGADTSLCTEDAYDAVQYAVLNGNKETVEYLVGELNATAQRRLE